MTIRADRVIVNARVWTDGAIVHGVDGLAIANGLVVAVGPSAEIEAHLPGSADDAIVGFAEAAAPGGARFVEMQGRAHPRIG